MTDAFRRQVASTFKSGMHMKRQMLEKRIKRAKCKCIEPGCSGTLHGTLAGPRNHLRFWCDGPCKRSMME